MSVVHKIEVGVIQVELVSTSLLAIAPISTKHE